MKFDAYHSFISTEAIYTNDTIKGVLNDIKRFEGKDICKQELMITAIDAEMKSRKMGETCGAYLTLAASYLAKAQLDNDTRASMETACQECVDIARGLYFKEGGGSYVAYSH